MKNVVIIAYIMIAALVIGFPLRALMNSLYTTRSSERMPAHKVALIILLLISATGLLFAVMQLPLQ